MGRHQDWRWIVTVSVPRTDRISQLRHKLRYPSTWTGTLQLPDARSVYTLTLFNNPGVQKWLSRLEPSCWVEVVDGGWRQTGLRDKITWFWFGSSLSYSRGLRFHIYEIKGLDPIISEVLFKKLWNAPWSWSFLLWPLSIQKGMTNPKSMT